jgi:hypothetical protein
MRRDDVIIRNEWSNYTNWQYKFNKPQKRIDNLLYTTDGQLYDPNIIGNNFFYEKIFFDDISIDDTSIGKFIQPPLKYIPSGPFNIRNDKRILKKIEILLDGKIRESKFDSGIFEYIEPFMRTNGGYNEGLYFYNFGIKNDPTTVQPSGAINLSKFTKIELEIETELPPLDPDAEFNVVCADLDGTGGTDSNQIIGVNKERFKLHKYAYDMRLFEEKYNVVNFTGGVCGLMFSR